VVKFSANAKIAIKATKLPKFLKIPFTIKKIVSDILHVTRRKNSLKDRVIHLFMAIKHTDSLSSAACSMASFLVAVKVITEHAIAWTEALGIVGYVVNFLSLGLSLEKVRESASHARKYGKILASLKGKEPEEKAKILSQALAELSECIMHLRKDFSLGKYINQNKLGRETLQDRARSLSKKLLAENQRTPEDLAESEQFLKTLTSRARRHLGFSVVKLVTKIISIIGGTLSFFVTPPTEIAALALSFTSGTLTLAVWGSRVLFVNKHPFDPNGMSNARKLLVFAQRQLHNIRLHLTGVMMGLRSVFTPRSRIPNLRLAA
jgi:hypothetical protein